MFKQINKRRWFTCMTIMVAMLFSSCSVRGADNKPPSAPLLTVKEVQKDRVSLAWSESYDDSGINEYRLYRNGDTLAALDDTEYDDSEVVSGEQYEYYVVAYDTAGNKSSKSVRQTVKVDDETLAVNPDGPTESEPPEIAQPGNGKTNDLNKLAKSTIRLYILDDDYICVGTGSGTIMNDQGHILTNYHCVADNYGLYNSEGYVAIALTNDVRVNSQPQYFAQFRSGNESLDLAVVQIVEDITGNRVSPGDLELLPAKIGDSDILSIGDEISLLGYPGVGGETITFTAGKVAGFLDDNFDNEMDWIKTDAIVNHGNSGGTAINKNGEMIGIPTAKQVGVDSDLMFYLKPINQAVPILEYAINQGGEPELPPRTDPYAPDYGDPYADVIDIYGFIVDSYTYEPIEGAIFVILQPGVTVQQFSDNPQESMILYYSEADYDGFFYCYDIPVGNSYAVIAGADDYMPILEDDALVIGADEDEDWYLGDIYLEASY